MFGAQPQKPPEFVALWYSAVVAYARCFNKGSRQRIDPEIFECFPSPEQYVESHKKLILLRDKLIAHRVNSLEISKSVMFVRPDGELIGTGHGWGRSLLPTRSFAERLHELAIGAYGAVAIRMGEIQPELDRQAAELTPAERLALPECDLPDYEELKEMQRLDRMSKSVPYKPRPPVGLTAKGKEYVAAQRAKKQESKQ